MTGAVTFYHPKFTLLFIKSIASYDSLPSNLPPQTLDQNPLYTEEELREYEQQLVNEENDINKKSDELQKQKEELQRKEEELNAQKLGLQQVN